MEQSPNIIPFAPEPKPKGFTCIPMKAELVEKASEIIVDPQVLINVVSQRVFQLNAGSTPRVKTLPSMGAADIALLEVIDGKIKFEYPADEEGFMS